MLHIINQLIDLLEPEAISAFLFIVIAQINDRNAKFQLETHIQQHNIIDAIVNLSKNLSKEELKQVKEKCLTYLSDKQNTDDGFAEDEDNGDSLPYPSVTKHELDKELDRMQRKREKCLQTLILRYPFDVV